MLGDDQFGRYFFPLSAKLRIIQKIIRVCNDDKCYGQNMSKRRNNKNFEFDSCKILRITHVRDRNLTDGRIYSKAEFDRMPNVPKFRSVD